MKAKPIGKKILVKVFQEEARSAGGIIIPDNAKESKSQGIVMELGTGSDIDNAVELFEFHVKIGDHVAFGTYAGDDLDLGDGFQYKVIEQREVIAVLTE